MSEGVDDSDSDSDSPLSGPSTDLREVAYQLRQHRHEFRELKRDISKRWEAIDRDEDMLHRFFNDWYGDPKEGKPSLGARVRRMVDQWEAVRFGGRVLIAISTMVASGVGYIIARFFENHR